MSAQRPKGRAKQKSLYQILKRPVITEKSQLAKEELSKVVFEVHKDANKIEIARAVEEIYDVEVLKVNTQRVRGKLKRRGRFYGRRPDWKKAVVTLAEGHDIDFYGEV